LPKRARRIKVPFAGSPDPSGRHGRTGGRGGLTMTSTTLARLFGAAALACLFGAPAHGQTRFTGQQGIYSLAVPGGWSQLPQNPNVDAAFASPGGISQGSFFVGLTGPQASLDAEANHAAEGKSSWGRRTLTIDGVPCITLQMSAGVAQDNFLACHIKVQFKSGPETVTFFMGSASPASLFSDQTAAFFGAANSVTWGDGVTP